MNITKRESMLLRKCINNYMLDNNLDYDKSPLFNDLIHKLKDFEKEIYNSYDKLERDDFIKFDRDSLNKELKKYNFQTIVNRKILELESENKTPKNYVKNRLTYKEWLEISKKNNNITLNNK
tara:strand:- start:2563 stop:2928 length:366 start_codon:yes stop_codon:yes gene_type:complete